MSSSKRFLKTVFCDTFHDHKLSIPEKFAAIHRDELSESVRLIVPTGGIWNVTLEKTGKTIWLRKLRKFMKDNCIVSGYNLMFKYIVTSTFKVHIFDSNGDEIKYPTSSKSAGHECAYRVPRSSRMGEDAEQSDEERQDEDDKDDEEEEEDDNSAEILGRLMDHKISGKRMQCPDSSEGRRELKVCSVSTGNKRLNIQEQEDFGILGRSMDHKVSGRSMQCPDSSKGRRELNVCCVSTGSKRLDIQEHPRGVGKSMQCPDSSEGRRDLNVCCISTGSKRLDIQEQEDEVTGEEKSVVESSKKSEKMSLIGAEKSLVQAQADLGVRAAKRASRKAISYRVTLKRYNIERCSLYLPAKFSEMYLSYESRFITLEDVNGNEWRVKCNMFKSKSCHLGTGWKKFLCDNHLVVGDTCIFEPFLSNGEVRIKVTISRGTAEDEDSV